MRLAWKALALVALAVGLWACAGGLDLPSSVPLVPAEGHPDPEDIPVDGGPEFAQHCQNAGCDTAHCEAFRDGGVGCGAICGDPCGALCTGTLRCRPADGGSWKAAYCTGAAGALTWSQSASCDDGSVCTANDRCQGQGICLGDRGPQVHRYHLASGLFGGTTAPLNTYAYGLSVPADGFVDEGPIFRGIPGGTVAIYQYFSNVETDRALTLGGNDNFDTTNGGYVPNPSSALAYGASSAAPGLSQIRRDHYSCCTDHSGGLRHFSAIDNAVPAEPTSGLTAGKLPVWVCPALP